MAPQGKAYVGFFEQTVSGANRPCTSEAKGEKKALKDEGRRKREEPADDRRRDDRRGPTALGPVALRATQTYRPNYESSDSKLC